MRPSLPEWVVDSLQVEPDRLVATGWILPSGKDSRLSITMNGVAADTKIGPARPDLLEAWGAAKAYAEPVTFVATGPAATRNEVDVVLAENGIAYSKKTWTFPIEERLPMPDARRRLRVCGTEVQQAFQRNGRSNFQRIHDLALQYRPLPRYRVLDWGSGAGAVARYALQSDAWDYMGVDIDDDNVTWCKENLDPNRFTTVGLQPPMPFDAKSFDLAFGISVLTHLNEQNQFTWLQELSRLVKTDGLTLLSVLGVQTLSRAPQLAEHMPEGFAFMEDDHEIGRLVGEPSYYGTAYHTEEYVRRRWSEWFRVVDYLPAALGHQDIVVLQAR